MTTKEKMYQVIFESSTGGVEYLDRFKTEEEADDLAESLTEQMKKDMEENGSEFQYGAYKVIYR